MQTTEKTDLGSFDDARRLAMRIFRGDEDATQEALGFAWTRFARGFDESVEFPLRCALYAGIREVKRGRRIVGNDPGRPSNENDGPNGRPITTPDGRLPLSMDDYATRPALVCAQDYRLELACDRAEVIDAFYAA